MTLIPLLFNGLSYGVLFFCMAVGLTVTMGMMRFTNLAHVSLCMLGGYFLVQLTAVWSVPFLVMLPLVFVLTAALSAALEVAVLRHFYRSDQLSQVLLTIGLLYMSITAAAWFWGPSYKAVQLPQWLVGQVEFAGMSFERYRTFLLVAGAAITAAIFYGLERTSFGATVRACVDNQRVAAASGLNTSLVYTLTFAIGGGLGGLGGALSANMIGLDPNFPLRTLVYVLIIVSVGGMGSIMGTLAAAMLVGVLDVLGKYYLPSYGGMMIYLIAIGVLIWRPEGFFRMKGQHA